MNMTNQVHVDSIDWTFWEPTELASLCFVIQDNSILLIHKKTGLGAGQINGPGGRLEADETPKQAAIRELEEEVGITPIEPEKYGELSFAFKDGYALHGTVFLTHSYTGTLIETDEAKPFWCDINKIPYDEMWKDDPYWLPILLQERQIRGFFVYDGSEMLSSRVFIF